MSIVAATLAITGTLSAQTTWTGNANANVNNAGNWNNGLPTSAGNPGTIGSGAGALAAGFSYSDYFVTQNGGSIAGSSWSLSNGQWTLNAGGEITGGVNVQGNNDGSQLLTVNGGTINATTLTVVQTAGAGRSATLVSCLTNTHMFAGEYFGDFQGASEVPVWGHTGQASNAENRQKPSGLQGCDENDPVPALLLSHVSHRICSFVASWQRVILIATNICVFVGQDTRYAWRRL